MRHEVIRFDLMELAIAYQHGYVGACYSGLVSGLQRVPSVNGPLLGHRPRECLDHQSPIEVFFAQKRVVLQT